jgi:hypothetical protein
MVQAEWHVVDDEDAGSHAAASAAKLPMLLEMDSRDRPKVTREHPRPCFDAKDCCL